MIEIRLPSILRCGAFIGLLIAGLLAFAGCTGGSQSTFAVATPDSTATPDILTQDERTWLREHPVIRVVQDPGWPPVEFADERGEPSGIAADYLQLIEQRLGVKFERVRDLSWQEAYARLKQWQVDMTVSVAETPERDEFLAFTKPYMINPIVIVTLADVTFIGDMQELVGKQVAVVDGYAVNEWIPRDYPGIRLVRVKTVQEGLESLQQGQVFAYVDNLLVVGHYLAKMRVTNVKIAGETPYSNAQSMAVRKDWAPLAGILQKALNSLSEAERADIYRKWVPIRYEHGFDYVLFWQALGIFGILLLGLTLWNWRLSREIKQRTRVEAALRRSEEQFRAMFQLASVGMAQADMRTGQWQRVNDKLCEITGYTAAEMLRLGQPEITHPEDRPRDREAWDHVLQGQVSDYSIEERWLRKDGTPIWVNVNTTIVRDATGRPARTMAAIEDITPRKQQEAEILAAQAELKHMLTKADESHRALLRVVASQKAAEEEIRRLNAELEQRVATRTAQLEASNSELEAFSYSVSHDLRAPLRAVVGYSTIVTEEHASRLGDEGRHFLTIIRDEALKMGQLIDDLLAFSRVGRRPLDATVIDMTALAQDVVDEVVSDPTRTIAVQLDPLPEAFGDPALIRQVWRNLLANAGKYTRHRARAVIHVGGSETDKERVYFVQDNGAGFDPRYADKLFGVFQRLHTDAEFEGTGIGLSIVQRIILRHGGRVWAESQVDQGATFYFSLPLNGNPG